MIASAVSRRAYERLSPRYRKVLQMRDRGFTLEDVARDFRSVGHNITRERVRQLEAKGRKKVEEYVVSKGALKIDLPPHRNYAVALISDGRILTPRERRIYDLGYSDGASSEDLSDRVAGDPSLEELGL